MTHRVVHDARTTLLVAVSLDTFARNASANADMKDASCVRQGEIATCCNRLGISNAWVLRRIHNYAEAQFVRPRTPAVLPRESPTKHWPLFKIWKTLSVATGSHAQFFQKRGREPR